MRQLINIFFCSALSAMVMGCNCENQVASEEVAACEDVMDGLAFPDNEEACDACCIDQGFEIGAPFGHVNEAENASCDCGNVGTCDE